MSGKRLSGICFLIVVTIFAVEIFVNASAVQVMAQTASPTPTASAQFTAPSASISFKAIPGAIANVNGVALVVTNNATGHVSLNFYYQCVPGSALSLGKCPSDGFLIFSVPVCDYPQAGNNSNSSCPTPDAGN
jgi:hypothetical protein